MEEWPGRIGVAPRRGVVAVEAHLRRGAPALIDSEGSDRSADYPEITEDLRRLPAKDLILIGSIGRGRSARLRVDDLLYLDGFGLRPILLDERRKLLRAFLAETDTLRIVATALDEEE